MQCGYYWPLLYLSGFPLLCYSPAGSSAHACGEFWLWDLRRNLGFTGNAACWCHQNTHAAVPWKVPQDKPGHCLHLQGKMNLFLIGATAALLLVFLPRAQLRWVSCCLYALAVWLLSVSIFRRWGGSFWERLRLNLLSVFFVWGILLRELTGRVLWLMVWRQTFQSVPLASLYLIGYYHYSDYFLLLLNGLQGSGTCSPITLAIPKSFNCLHKITEDRQLRVSCAHLCALIPPSNSPHRSASCIKLLNDYTSVVCYAFVFTLVVTLAPNWRSLELAGAVEELCLQLLPPVVYPCMHICNYHIKANVADLSSFALFYFLKKNLYLCMDFFFFCAWTVSS